MGQLQEEFQAAMFSVAVRATVDILSTRDSKAEAVIARTSVRELPGRQKDTSCTHQWRGDPFMCWMLERQRMITVLKASHTGELVNKCIVC